MFYNAKKMIHQDLYNEMQSTRYSTYTGKCKRWFFCLVHTQENVKDGFSVFNDELI